MKNRFQFLNISRLATSLMMLVFSVVFLASCDEDDNEAQPTQDIVALAQGNPDLSTLVSALTKYPDLVSTLQGSGQFTVFAPTNTAFASLLTAIGQTSLDDIPEAVLRDVLEYHVVSTAAVLSTQLAAGPVPTVGG